MLLTVCLNLQFSQVVHAYSNKKSFEHISIEKGLAQSSVHTILQDCDGFLWIGTEDGLDRYDGFQFKHYRHDIDDTLTISHNSVYDIHEDNEGYLWICTAGGGLNRLDRSNDKFYYYMHSPDDPHSISSNDVNTICEDYTGKLWIGTDNGLDMYDRNRDIFVHYIHNPQGEQSLCNDRVNCIYEDKQQQLWIGTNEGVNILDRTNNTFRRFKLDIYSRQAYRQTQIKCIFEDSRAVLWFGTSDGLVMFNPKNNSFTHFVYDENDENSLAANEVHAIFEDHLGVLWVGTYGGGVHIYDREQKNFQRFQHNSSDPNSLSDNLVRAIYEDGSGVLWIGTWIGGLNKLVRSSARFEHYYYLKNDKKSLSHNSVYAIHKDIYNNYWIGTSDGLNKLNRETGIFEYYFHDPHNSRSLSSSKTWAICENPNSKGRALWIGTNKGLNLFDIKTHTSVRYQNNPADEHSLSNDLIFCLYNDSQNQVWIGTNGGGLNQYDALDRQFIRYQYDAEDQHSISSNIVYAILEDSQHTLWIGTGGGLNRFDRKTKQFTRYLKNAENPYSISHDVIYSLYEDSDNILWIGTKGGGLNQFDKTTERFTHYTVKDGLANNWVYRSYEDSHDNLWISTNNGLSKFNKESGLFTNYYESHGLQSNEFNIAGYFDDNGEILLGGIHGFNIFHPDSISKDTFIPPVVFTDFKIFNKSVPVGVLSGEEYYLEKIVTELDEITLPYDKNVFTFEFAALHFIDPGNNEYAYKLENFEEEWNYVGNRCYATYTNIPPGRYIFKVKAANNDKIWNEKGVSLNVEIIPPYWQEWWFRGLLGLTALAIAFAIHEIRLHQMKKHKVLLETQVAERTAELKKATAELQRSNAELEQFAYIASHDLQEPLRKVQAFGDRLGHKYSGALDEKGQDYLARMLNATQRMQLLINNLLTYSRVTTKAQPFVDVDVHEIVTSVLCDLENRIEETQGRVEVRELPRVSADPMQMRQLFQNLIGNALKFHRDGVEPEINIYTDMSSNGMYKIHVQDNGIGFDEKYSDRIFQVFQRLHGKMTYEGTGIGLAICKKIVERHGGNICVHSAPNKGTTFIINLPKIR